MYIVKIYDYWNNEIRRFNRDSWTKAVRTARFYAVGRNWSNIEDEKFTLLYHVEATGVEIDYKNTKIER